MDYYKFMPNTTNDSNDDSSERFSLLELDLPKDKPAAKAEAPVKAAQVVTASTASTEQKTCNCRAFLGPGQALPLSVRGVCPRCSRPRAKPPVSPPAQVVESIFQPPVTLGAGETVTMVNALGQISSESTHNANTQGIGSMAGGQMQGVGFSTVEGYIQAIRNGVTARTHREYMSVLSRRFRLTATQINALQLPGPQIMQDGHVVTASPVVTMGNVDMPALRSGDLLAGAVAEGHGVLTGFSGRGTVTRAKLISALTEFGFPIDWAPRAKSAHAQAGNVLGKLNAQGYVVRADRSKATVRSGETVPTWTARWTVSLTARGREVGEAAGSIVLTATLIDSQLTILASDAGLADMVSKQFDAACGGEVYQAADITAWLQGVFRSQFRAARLGGTWYVKRKHAANAERLLQAMASLGWGENFMLPALPVATSEQLRKGIADGFDREIAELCAEFTARVEDKQAGPIGPRAAAAFHARLRTLTERCAAFSALLGQHHVVPMKAKLVTASESMQEFMSDVAIRFGHIFDELARDAT